MRMVKFVALLGAAALVATHGYAAEPAGALPGDDALTCDEIYAQGMAETRRDQDARQHDIAAMKARSQANAALLGAAMATGGLSGTGPAAEAGMRAQADDALAKGAAQPPPRPRMDRLKALWSERHCARPETPPAAASGDDAMTCEQIATELAPYTKEMVPNLAALNASNQQMLAHGYQVHDERMAAHAGLNAMAAAGAVDPTGAAKRAYAVAEAAQTTQERAEDEAYAHSEVAQQNRAQQETLVAQGRSLQSDARVQHLWQLAQQKGCGRK